VVLLDEAQERRFLIGDARHRQALAQRAGEQRVELVARHVTVGLRDGIAMRVRFGPPQHLVDALDEAVGHDVLELFGLVVHLVPAEPHHPHEEQLDQPMPPEDQRRKLLARGAEPHAVVGLVFHQAGFGQGLHHGGGRARRHAQSRRQLTHRQEALPLGQVPLAKVDGLQVVLDGAGRKHCRIMSLAEVSHSPFDILRHDVV